MRISLSISISISHRSHTQWGENKDRWTFMFVLLALQAVANTIYARIGRCTLNSHTLDIDIQHRKDSSSNGP